MFKIVKRVTKQYNAIRFRMDFLAGFYCRFFMWVHAKNPTKVTFPPSASKSGTRLSDAGGMQG